MKVTKNLFNNYIVMPDEGEIYVVPSWDIEKYAEIELHLKNNPKDEIPYQPTRFEYNAVISSHAQYLLSTDWYVVRYAETGIEIPSEISQKRQDARDKISELRLSLFANC